MHTPNTLRTPSQPGKLSMKIPRACGVRPAPPENEHSVTGELKLFDYNVRMGE